MKIDLKKYMTERDQLRAQKKNPGPLLTLSRQYGCEANEVTIKLLNRINQRLTEKSVNARAWKYISKEIIQEAASELKLSEERLTKRVLQHHEHGGIMDAMFSSLSTAKNLKDKTIIQKINEIIQTYAHDGKVIIVGRGGAMLTRSIPLSLHVRIFAPFEWRVAFIADKHKLSQLEAEERVRINDQERITWTEHLTGQTFDEHLFDILLNRQTLSSDEMVDIIYHLMIKKALI